MMALGSTCIGGVGTVRMAAHSGTGGKPGILLAPSEAPLQGGDAETPRFSAGDGSFGASVASFRAPQAWLDAVNFLWLGDELFAAAWVARPSVWHGSVILFPLLRLFAWVDFGL